MCMRCLSKIAHIRLARTPRQHCEPGQHVPVHIHSNQEQFIPIQEGVLDLKLDGNGSEPRLETWCACHAASRGAISANRTRPPVPYSGCRRPASWKTIQQTSQGSCRDGIGRVLAQLSEYLHRAKDINGGL